MNDFTKEELLEIYGLLEKHYCDPEKCFNPNPKLLLKIEAMISNYCDHEKIGFYFIQQQKIVVEQCIKCQLWTAYEMVDDNE